MSDQPGPGTMIGGRYRLERAIGEGGHGVVYAATDTHVGRSVAVKVMHAVLSGKADLQTRFEREAMLARSLNHPNTVRLLDFGRDDRGAFFIVYELLEGQGLDAALRGGAMAPDRVARLGKQVLKSLMEAHAAGAVHRDIKPSNIFLCDFSGEKDFVKVLDFGIAKVDDVDLTDTGCVIGTPSYMAPECINGEEVTAATDLYALGLVLAEALTGAVVMQGDNPTDVAGAQAAPDPVPLPPAVLQSPLGPVIHRAVQKPLTRRYAAAKDMLGDLDAITTVGATPTIGSAPARLSEAPTGVVSLTEPGTPPAAPSPGSFAPAPFVAQATHTRRKSSGGFWVGFLALAAIVLIVGAGATVLVLGADADTSSSPDKKEKKRTKTKKSSAPTTPPPDPVAPQPAAVPSPAPIPESPSTPAPPPSTAPTPAAPRPVTPRPVTPSPVTPPPPKPSATPSATPQPIGPCGCALEDLLCQLRCAQGGGK